MRMARKAAQMPIMYSPGVYSVCPACDVKDRDSFKLCLVS